MTKLNIYQKLNQIQSQIQDLPKTELNRFQNYKYFTEYDALDLVKPLLATQGLALTFSDVLMPNAPTSGELAPQLLNINFQARKDKDWVVQYCKQAILTNSEQPSEQITLHFWACGQNSDVAKAKGSAETYAIKYFLQKLFLIPTSDNLDPDRDKGEKIAGANEQDKVQAEEFLRKHGLGTKN